MIRCGFLHTKVGFVGYKPSHDQKHFHQGQMHPPHCQMNHPTFQLQNQMQLV
jgi:hypothetical protein